MSDRFCYDNTYALQVARDVGTLWTTLQPPSDCSPSDRQGLLLEVATASAAAHAAWQSEQAVKAQVHTHNCKALLLAPCSTWLLVSSDASHVAAFLCKQGRTPAVWLDRMHTVAIYSSAARQAAGCHLCTKDLWAVLSAGCASVHFSAHCFWTPDKPFVSPPNSNDVHELCPTHHVPMQRVSSNPLLECTGRAVSAAAVRLCAAMGKRF